MPGDINADDKIDLSDAILALQVISKMPMSEVVHSEADLDNDMRIGLVEVLYILQRITGIRTDSLCIEIQVSPSTLNIQSQGEVVTVHTSIGYSAVLSGAITLNGIPIDWWKSEVPGKIVDVRQLGAQR